MNKVVAIIVFWCCAVFSFGQTNLVPNPGFEEYKIACPNNNFINIKNWFQGAGSVDIFHKCKSQPPFPPGSGVPQNDIGYQFPYNDSAYLGFILYSSIYVNGIKEYREYIEVKLYDSLKRNYTYCVEFYVSLADTADYAISSLGAYLSIDSISNDCISTCLLNYSPQIQNDSLNIITDKQNWVKISGSFVAKGGEQYLTIGNFYGDNFTERHLQKISNNNSGWSNYSYYYIDNVIVYACDSPAVSINDSSFVLVSNVFSPNQDDVNDLWQITANQVLQLSVQVFNRWGEEVYVFNSQNLQSDTSTTLRVTYNPAWDGFTKSGLPVSDGTYFYVISYTLPNGETKVEKGTLTLIR